MYEKSVFIMKNGNPPLLYFQASQCIPMGSNLPLMLTLGVGIPLDAEIVPQKRVQLEFDLCKTVRDIFC